MKRDLYEALAKLCAEHGSADAVQALGDAFGAAADVTDDADGEALYRAAARNLLALGQHVFEYEANEGSDMPSLAMAFEVLAEGEELGEDIARSRLEAMRSES